MYQTVEAMSDIASQSASSMQHVASSAEVQLSLMDDILSSSDMLKKLAQDLELMVKRFKV